ncbi:FAD-dependent oxidoreductase [Thalassoglobus sp.]|uniref:FAD-dependent oxidoreductase n=1 Tax=Thalassoglobus sp. TaxID=2795869 RepID=UPI003AA88054
MLQNHSLSCDILVAGGGPAGVPCALAAARNGAKVILCQDRSVLGGNASSEVRMHIVGANGTGSFDRGAELETEAREGGIIEEIRLENCVRNPQRSAAIFDLILYDLCRNEPNLTLMLNTTVTGAEVEGNRIRHAIAERQSTEDRFQIAADIFIDCTGDGRLGVEAGAAFLEGREDREAYAESLAVEVADSQRLGSTILLQARKHSNPMPYLAPRWARKFSKQDLKLRLYSVPGEEEPTHEYGYWWAEWGGTLDTIKDNETIRDELLAIALGIWDHVKNAPPESEANDDPFEAANWALDWIGFLPGKRESRRFIGQHLLTQSDILSSRQFADTIAYGGWSLDLHPPEGVDAPEKAPCTQTRVPYLYDIPLQCCIAQKIENLMFAGRNISATHVGFSSTRVMATCAAIGQGVGTAAAYAQQQNLSPSVLPQNQTAIHTIQQTLHQDDAFLIGQMNRVPKDLAISATITASSEQQDGLAINVISGQTRSVHGPSGAPPSRANAGSHRWMSVPEQGFPAWLQFEWDRPVSITEVHLVFDTGLHRHLTLSHHDGYTSKMIWGRPQPETVSDYEIKMKREDAWVTEVLVTGNYQRLRKHQIESTFQTNSLRIEVTGTNGLPHARIMEVRLLS